VTVETPEGILLRTLVTGRLEPGEQAVLWDGRGRDGKLVGGGRYLVRVTAANELGTVALDRELRVRRIAGARR
jgi:flagellar hook assembly protein FlgD